MAFMGRGRTPHIGKDINKQNNNNDNEDESYYGGMWYDRIICYYVPYDNTYVIMEIIMTLIIFIVGIITYLKNYKSTIVDPIENTKKIFINSHLIAIAILLVITFVINLLSKKQKTFFRNIVFICITSLIIMFTFLCIKLNLDMTYTKNKFKEIYIEQNGNEMSVKKTKVDVGLSGVNFKTEKEYYADECMKLYNIFKLKSYSTIGLHLLLNLLLIYQVIKEVKINMKKEKVNMDDEILFDDEQNVKY